MAMFHAVAATLCLLGLILGVEPDWLLLLGAVFNILAIPMSEDAWGG